MVTMRGDLAHHLDDLEEELAAFEERDPVDLDEWHEEAAESLRHDTEIDRFLAYDHDSERAHAASAAQWVRVL